MRQDPRSPLRALLLLIVLAPGLLGQEPPPAPHVQVELLSGVSSWVAGSQVDLGIRFVIDDEWHIYWPGQNDSGMAPGIEWQLPSGFMAGEIAWPAPERHLSPGDILDHVYHHEATLVIPLHVPEDLPVGGSATVRADLTWLVCRDVCLMESGSVELTLPVAVPPSDPPPEPPALVAARERLPGPLPGDAALGWEGEVFVLTVPGAEALEFFPEERGLPLADIVERCSVAGPSLRLLPDRDLTGGSRVRGVLAVERESGTRTFHQVDAPGA